MLLGISVYLLSDLQLCFSRLVSKIPYKVCFERKILYEQLTALFSLPISPLI